MRAVGLSAAVRAPGLAAALAVCGARISGGQISPSGMDIELPSETSQRGEA